VAPEYFEFGLVLIKAVGEAVTEERIVTEWNVCMANGRREVKINATIKDRFYESSTYSSLSTEEKETILDQLVDKVCIARFGAILRAHKDRTIGRQGTR